MTGWSGLIQLKQRIAEDFRKNIKQPPLQLCYTFGKSLVFTNLQPTARPTVYSLQPGLDIRG